MTPQLHGLHHATAITAHAPSNKAFYTGVLGMRMVKKTVNQDQTSAYHLFYADGAGNAGTDLTFFEFPTPPERRGTRSICEMGLRVSPDSLDFWRERLAGAGLTLDTARTRTIGFEDPEGQRLRLIADAEGPAGVPWADSPVPEAHRIHGLGAAVLSVPDIAPTEAMLTRVMGMRSVGTGDADGTPVHVFAMGEGGPAAEVHVRVEPDLPAAGQGAGGMHHLAFRTSDEDQLRAWVEHLTTLRIPSSGEVDRFYFRSLYFRDPSGILFEIATDGPGFATDEPAETMGEALALPPFLEPQRAAIEAGLEPLS